MAPPAKAEARRKKLAAPKENLIMKLPAELRNAIYHEALANDSRTASGGMPQWDAFIEGRTWQEPGLLRTSKQIRSETLPIYFHTTKFSVTVHVDKLESLRRSLASIKERFSIEINGDLWLKAIHSERLDALLPLARIAYEFPSAFRGGCWSQRICIFVDIVDEVVALGRKAAAEDMHEDLLEIEFEEWLVEKLREKVGDTPWSKKNRWNVANGLTDVIVEKSLGLPGDFVGARLDPGEDDETSGMREYSSWAASPAPSTRRTRSMGLESSS